MEKIDMNVPHLFYYLRIIVQHCKNDTKIEGINKGNIIRTKHKAYKFRIYPTKDQEVLLAKTIQVKASQS